MSTRTLPTRAAVAPIPRVALAQIRAVLLVYWRMPAFVVISMGLPIMFFVFFGLPNVAQKTTGGISLGAFILGSLGAYAVSNVVVYNVGIGVANQRARKYDLLQRASPLPAWIAVIANIVGGLLLAMLALLALFSVAALGGVRMGAGTWVALIAWLVVGCLPMLGLGLSIGYGGGPSTAPALASLIYLPMAFASGIFIPLPQLPSFIRSAAPFLPLYHYGQLAWITVGAGDESLLTALLWVAGWSVLLLGLAARLYRLDASRKFG
ncbi:MAG TPA: ABC transporter permease [Candidatus Limnocylindrales bacterium]|nr:ABC transporter permease [Candidatus Limnocylindrales bacterium]